MYNTILNRIFVMPVPIHSSNGKSGTGSMNWMGVQRCETVIEVERGLDRFTCAFKDTGVLPVASKTEQH